MHVQLSIPRINGWTGNCIVLEKPLLSDKAAKVARAAIPTSVSSGPVRVSFSILRINERAEWE